MSVSAQFRTHCADSPAPALSRSTRSGLSGIDSRQAQRARRPGVCVGAPCLVWSALYLARPALLPVLCSLSGCAGVGGGTPAGHTAAAQPRPVSPITTEKIKKAQKPPHPHCQSQKSRPKKQKDPYKGSVFCAILALQALKGRNLQWLKVK